MANRSYLYALTNQPTGFEDRPERVTGLTEFPYAIPFVSSLLVSVDTTVSTSLIAPGLDGDDPARPTRLPALSAPMAPGVDRLERFLAAVRAAAPEAQSLHRDGEEALEFLAGHREEFLQLETIELDIMDYDDQSGFDEAIAGHLAAAEAAGAAVEALPRNDGEAGRVLREAVASGAGVLAPFRGLRLDGEEPRDDGAPMGLSHWSTVLYFDVQNRAEFESGKP